MNNTKKVLFRADAKPEIGIGDLMSLIHLSTYFEKDGWQVSFMIRSYGAAIRLVEKYKVDNLEIIDEHLSILDEVQIINRFVRENEIDLIFFEITEHKISDYTGLVPDVYKACVSFDGGILSNMDLVVDWDVEAGKFFHPENHPNTRFLLGPEYVILPPNFDMERVAGRQHRSPPSRLLISMGGADEYNLTCEIVKALIVLKIKMHTTVIIGSGYQFRSDLEACLKDVDFDFEILENISNMFEEYMKCDMAIGAGGLTSSELVASGTPAFLIASYKHQEARCRYFDGKGWATYLGDRLEYKNNIAHILNYQPKGNLSAAFDTKAIVRACNGFTKQ